MAQTVCVTLSAADLARLSAIVAGRAQPLKHIQRARIVLLSAERLSILDGARQAGVSRPAVWRWQRRYAEEGVEGLLRDKTHPPGKPPHSTDTVAEVLALTCSKLPGEATHWSSRALAQAVRITAGSAILARALGLNALLVAPIGVLPAVLGDPHASLSGRSRS